MHTLGSVVTWGNGPEVPDECNGPEVPDDCILFGVALQSQKSMPGVSRMSLCSSLFVVKQLFVGFSSFQRGVRIFRHRHFVASS